MHPTDDELRAMATPAQIARHIGMAGPAVDAFFEIVGIDDPDDIAVISFMAALTITQFEQDLADWTWEVDGADGTKLKKKARAKERGQAGIFHRYCRLVAALPASGRDKAPPTTPGESLATLPTASGPGTGAAEEEEPPVEAVAGRAPARNRSPTPDKTVITMTGVKRQIQETKGTVPRTVRPKYIKLSNVIDQNAEQETLPLPKGDEQAAYDHWNDLTGDDPPADVEPTADQLAALQTVVDDGGPPFADFAVWGNRTYRDSRRPKLRGLRPGGDGLWYPVLFAAPENCHVWTQCYDVWRVGVIMLKIILTFITDRYRAKVVYYHGLYGHACWHIIARADQLARENHWERCRRRCAKLHRQGRLPHYDDGNPWGTAMEFLIDDATFWTEHVTLPCTLVAANAAAHTKLSWDSDTSAAAIAPTPAAIMDAPPTRQRDTQQTEDLSQKSDGKYTHNRKGVELCRGYRTGGCLKKDKNNRCAANAGRVHQCDLCLQVHQGNKCSLNKKAEGGGGGGGRGNQRRGAGRGRQGGRR